jgi:hypothetical protein
VNVEPSGRLTSRPKMATLMLPNCRFASGFWDVPAGLAAVAAVLMRLLEMK